MEGATAHIKERIGIKRVGCGSAYAKCENTQGTARRSSTWIPPRFSSSYLSFCWLAAAAGTAGAAGTKQTKPRCEVACASNLPKAHKAVGIAHILQAFPICRLQRQSIRRVSFR